MNLPFLSLSAVRHLTSGVPAIPGAGAIALLAGLAVSGCSTFSASQSTAFLEDCLSDSADIIEKVDWDTVQPDRVRIVDNNYRPMVMSFEQGRPYTLVITNADPSSHSLWAPSFMKQGIALKSVQIGDNAPAMGCVNGVRIAPRSTVTLRFVPVWEGRYEMFDSGFALIPGQLTAGVFHIVEPRVGLAAK